MAAPCDRRMFLRVAAPSVLLVFAGPLWRRRGPRPAVAGYGSGVFGAGCYGG